MRKHALKLISVLALTLLAMLCVPQRAAADDDDPPTRVARLSHVDGSVSFEPGGTDEWVTAVVNRPMTTGDKLWADHDSRAELHIGSASIRLGSSTGFSFLNLNDNTVQLQVTEGTLRIRVKRLDRDDNFEVDTPNLAFSILRPGVYRISVNEAGDTTVVNVRDGEGQVTGGGESYSVYANETGTFTGADQLYADIVGLGNDDDLERWSEERDRRDDHATARRYVSDDVVGYEDLDEYGGWRDVPEYGTVWFPRTAVAGWAPYRYGHWVYIQPWGYTWVDDEPWGFAPFHYGRWIAVGGAWGWVPCRPRAVVGVAYCSRRGLCAAGLRASAGRVDWRPTLCGGRSGRRREQRGLVPTGSARSLRSFLSREPNLREQREYIEHHGKYDGGEQLLQHERRQQQHDSHEREICEPASTRRRHGDLYTGPHHFTAGGAERCEG